MFSIGYATKSFDTYVKQLSERGVNVVADIRSVPYSRAFHDYNRETFERKLRAQGIRYVYLGAELGPRSKNPADYNDDGQVQFDRLMGSLAFKAGIGRLFDGLEKGFTIALSCAEKDPAICHRSLLVGWALKHHYNRELQHILHDGQLESQSSLEHRLLAVTETQADMLLSDIEALQLAYQRQCQTCAYRLPQQ